MKRLLLFIACIALSACSTFGPVPRYSLGYGTVPPHGFYGGGYSSYYSNSAWLRSSAIRPHHGYYPYYFGSSRISAEHYVPHYYRSHGLGHGIGHGLRH